MANESYVNNGTALSINGEAGADYAWSVEGIINGAGRVSAQIDLGAAPRPSEYQWSCEVQFQATPTQGKGLELYVSEAPDGDSTQMDGDVGASDADISDPDTRRNLKRFGLVISENAAASEKCIASGVITTYCRYISLLAWDSSGASVNATDSNFQFTLQPKYQQGQ